MINLATVWGLSQEKGKEALTKLARHVVVSAQLRRTSFRGVIDVVYGGEQPERVPKAKEKVKQTTHNKRKMQEEVEHASKKQQLNTEMTTKSAIRAEEREQAS